MSYSNCLDLADIASLSTRRNELSRNFFHSTIHPTSSLHSLLPPPRDPDLLPRLRAPTKFPRIPSRTKNISPLYHTPFPVIKQLLSSPL